MFIMSSQLISGLPRGAPALPARANPFADSAEKGSVNENVMCSSPVTRVNGVTHSILISYAIHFRYSPDLHRGSAGAPRECRRQNAK